MCCRLAKRGAFTRRNRRARPTLTRRLPECCPSWIAGPSLYDERREFHANLYWKSITYQHVGSEGALPPFTPVFRSFQVLLPTALIWTSEELSNTPSTRSLCYVCLPVRRVPPRGNCAPSRDRIDNSHRDSSTILVA